MSTASLPGRFFARSAPVRVGLEHPVEVPGGVVASVRVRPLYERMGKLAATGLEGEITAIADSLGLPREVVMEMADSDYERVLDALDEALARAVRAGGRTPAPRLVGDSE